MSKSLRPLKSNILVKPNQKSEQLESGLFLPPSALKNDMPEGGAVVAVGSDVEDIKVGDEVVFKKYASSDVEMNGVKYMLVPEDDVLAVVE